MRSLPSRCGLSRVLATLLLLAALCVAGTDAALAEEAWEREVARAQRQQDRLLKSAATRGTGLANVVRRYKQQVVNDGSALNYYLLGRVFYRDGRADETVRHMRRALELDPRFYFANRALAIVYLDKERPTDAEHHILELRRKKPDDLQGLKLETSLRMGQRNFTAAERLIRQVLERDPEDQEARRALAYCYFGQKDWKRARAELRRLILRAPRDVALRRSYVDCVLRMEDWKAASTELRQLIRVMPDDPLLRWQLALALFEQGLLAECVAELEKLDGLTKDKPALYVLDLMQVVYGKLQRHQDRIRVLKRMVPLIQDEEERKRLEAAIEALEKGGAAGAGDPAAEWKRNPLAELLERCVHRDPAIRRQALHEYFEHDLPFVDPVIYRRYDPKVEPDTDCRIWVVRILGRYRAGEADASVVRDVSRYVALALEDPESRVRTVASEELGQIGAKAGLVYLLPHLDAMKLGPVPADPAARRRMEAEFNAARLALCALTGRRDLAIGEGDWAPAARMEAVRADWKKWLDRPQGVAARLAALKELADVANIDPRWQLRYVLVDVIRPSPAAVALESYRVLRDRVEALGEKAASDPWWQTFPVVPDTELDEARLPALRERLKGWWGSLKR